MASIADTQPDGLVAGPAKTGETPADTGRWVRIIGYTAAGFAIAGVCVSFLVLLGLTPIDPTPEVNSWALIVNGAVLIVLIGALAWELSRLIQARRRGQAAARLHGRIIALFSAVAVTPAILVAVVASITLDRGLDNWFSNTMQETVNSSVALADEYVDVISAQLMSDVSQMAATLENRSPFEADLSGAYFAQVTESFGFRSAVLMDADGNTQREAVAPGASYPQVPEIALANAVADPAVRQLIRPGQGPESINLIGAIVTVPNVPGGYLYVVREFDMAAAQNLLAARSNAAAYAANLENRNVTQMAWGVLFFGVSIVVLVVAVWFGLGVANRIVSPIRRLIGAANRVAAGDLRGQVAVRRSDGDIGTLGESFNRMTAQLLTQREELIGASEQIDSRRRFIEAVLSGVTAGVLGVDREARVTILNRTALRLLHASPDSALGAPVVDLVPELLPLMTTVLAEDRREYSDQVTLTRAGRPRTVNVRVTTESTATENHGYVITMDDITDLVAAQRTSAWADVARRIAHEIKNPLTPIQLSAERLRRKFGKTIVDDRAVFDQCTETIIRQVGDIGRMVDEFSAFARMPKPALEERDLRDSVREATFLMQVGNPEIDIVLDLPDEPMPGRFDSRLLTQAVTNLIKNGSEAIVGLTGPAEKGRIEVSAFRSEDCYVVAVTDNGIGLPKEDRHRLLEPYMTTREKGTGLGLAIVRKIAEDHAGKIELLDAPAVATGGHGATVRLVFPVSGVAPGAANGAAKERTEPSALGTAAE
ncbi:MAG: PAS domain-containing sensor histidine kinase [Bauldia sp.]|nr:PAS domain-containing sensor histidine kinase [Bauldia sp.]